MSTRSTITFKKADGTKTSIYCHYDGYIEGVGVTLQLAYNTADKVKALMSLGDLSSLGYYTEPKTSTHSFNAPENDVCVAYHRDRGEPFRQSHGVNDYNYTFDEKKGVWYVKYNRRNHLLLDEILKADFSSCWLDDEFATKTNIHAVCTAKAAEAMRS